MLSLFLPARRRKPRLTTLQDPDPASTYHTDCSSKCSHRPSLTCSWPPRARETSPWIATSPACLRSREKGWADPPCCHLLDQDFSCPDRPMGQCCGPQLPRACLVSRSPDRIPDRGYSDFWTRQLGGFASCSLVCLGCDFSSPLSSRNTIEGCWCVSFFGGDLPPPETWSCLALTARCATEMRS